MATLDTRQVQVQGASPGDLRNVVSNRPDPGKLISGLGKTAFEGFENIKGIVATQKATEIVNDAETSITRGEEFASFQQKNPLIANPNLPDDVNLSIKEFGTISEAVANGGLDRDKARVLVSARVRRSISEQPLFASEIRKAASGLLGFNLETEPTREFLSQFPDKSNTGLSAVEKARQLAQFKADTLGVSVDVILTEQFEAERLKNQSDIVKAKVQLGQAGVSDSISAETASINNFISATVMETILTRNASGTGVKLEEVKPLIAKTTIEAKARLRTLFPKDSTSQAFKDSLAQIDQGATDLQDFLDTVDVDKLNDKTLARLQNSRAIFGEQNFRELLILGDIGGRENVGFFTQILSSARNPAELDALINSNPVLSSALTALSGNKNTFVRNMANTAAKMLGNGSQPLNSTDAPFVDAVISKTFADDSEATPAAKESVIAKLQTEGLNTKAFSVLVGQSPIRVQDQPSNVDFVKLQFNQRLPNDIEKVSELVSTNTEFLEFKGIKQDGTIDIGIKAGSFNPQDATNVGKTRRRDSALLALNQISKINQGVGLFTSAINNGWGSQVGHTKSSFNKFLNDTFTANLTDKNTTRVNTQVQQSVLEIKALFDEGNLTKAEKEFNKLKESTPNITITFDQIKQRIESQGN